MTSLSSKTATSTKGRQQKNVKLIKGLIEKFAPSTSYQEEIASPTADMTLETMIGLFRMRPRVMVYTNGRDALTGEEMEDCDIIENNHWGEYYEDDDTIVLLPGEMYRSQTEYILTYIHELAHSSFSAKRLRKLDKNGRMIRRFDEEAAATMVEFMAVTYCGTRADLAIPDIDGHDIFYTDARRALAGKQNDNERFFCGCSLREIENTVRFAVESFKYFIRGGRWGKQSVASK